MLDEATIDLPSLAIKLATMVLGLDVVTVDVIVVPVVGTVSLAAGE